MVQIRDYIYKTSFSIYTKNSMFKMKDLRTVIPNLSTVLISEVSVIHGLNIL